MFSVCPPPRGRYPSLWSQVPSQPLVPCPFWGKGYSHVLSLVLPRVLFHVLLMGEEGTSVITRHWGTPPHTQTGWGYCRPPHLPPPQPGQERVMLRRRRCASCGHAGGLSYGNGFYHVKATY